MTLKRTSVIFRFSPHINETKSRSKLTKAFFREFKVYEKLFHNRMSCGAVASVKHFHVGPQPSVFACTTGETTSETPTTEVFYICLLHLQSKALDTLFQLYRFSYYTWCLKS